MGASPPKQVVDLVERFSRDRKVFLSPDYKEEQLRDTAYGRQLTAFRLRPSDSDSGRSAVSRKLMASSARGWDVANKAGLTEVFKPVIHEESIKIAGATKAQADGSQLAAHGSPFRQSTIQNRESEMPVAVSRKPMADVDRLIFLRICEDRGIEHYAFLQSLMNGERIYPRLVKHFRDAIDGTQLTAYSLRLDSDSGPSAASRKPMADPNGQVYEQFLGKVIRLTPSHQAEVEETFKSLVRVWALDGTYVPRRLSAMQSEPCPALADSVPTKMSETPRGS